MAIIKQHVPNFFDTIIPAVNDFNTLGDLLEIPFVKMYRLNFKGEPDEYFYRYSLSSDNNILLAEIFQGEKYVIVGYIIGDHNLQLPKRVLNETDFKELQNFGDIS